VRRRSTVLTNDRWGWVGEEPNHTTARKHGFMQQVYGQIFKDDVNGFSFASDIFFFALFF
jgi:hypothetical protein